MQLKKTPVWGGQFGIVRPHPHWTRRRKGKQMGVSTLDANNTKGFACKFVGSHPVWIGLKTETKLNNFFSRIPSNIHLPSAYRPKLSKCSFLMSQPVLFSRTRLVLTYPCTLLCAEASFYKLRGTVRLTVVLIVSL